MINLKEILIECINLYKAEHSYRINWTHCKINDNFNENKKHSSAAEYDEFSDTLIIYLCNTKNEYKKYKKIASNNRFSNFSFYDFVSFTLDHELIHYDIKHESKLPDGKYNYAIYLFFSEAIVNYKQYINYHKNDKTKFNILRCRILDLIDTIKYINESNELYDTIKKPKPIMRGFNLHPKYSDDNIINFYGCLAGYQIVYNKLKDTWSNELNNFSKNNSILAKYLNQFSCYILNVVDDYIKIDKKLLDKIDNDNNTFIDNYKLRTYKSIPQWLINKSKI